MDLTKIEVSNYSDEEVEIIADKLNDLSINWMKQIDIHILDKIDIKTYNFIVDFSK